MKRTITLSLIGLLSLSSAVSLIAQGATGGVEKEITALETQWTQSQKTNNPDQLAPLLAEKFVGTGADGTMENRTETLAEAKATKWTSAGYEDLQVTVYGSTAIATSVYIAKGTDAKGKPMDVRQRYTDTWVKMPDGKWQVVASHGSDIKK